MTANPSTDSPLSARSLICSIAEHGQCDGNAPNGPAGIGHPCACNCHRGTNFGGRHRLAAHPESRPDPGEALVFGAVASALRNRGVDTGTYEHVLSELRAALSPVPTDRPEPLDDFADRLAGAMREHILDRATGWPHIRSGSMPGDGPQPIEGCDDTCATNIAIRLAAYRTEPGETPRAAANHR
jgi:hypothetical protein